MFRYICALTFISEAVYLDINTVTITGRVSSVARPDSQDSSTRLHLIENMKSKSLDLLLQFMLGLNVP